jgi:DmsE family decaheme c-type cytochrome
LLCLVVFGIASFAFAAETPRASFGPSAATPAPQSADDSTALFSTGGSATCLGCHNTSAVSDILHTVHGVKGDPHTPFAQHECESCHGPSDAHVQGFKTGKFVEPDIVFDGPHASPVTARNQICLGCHQDAERMNWEGSPHQRNDLACVNCHTLHAVEDPVLAKQTEVDVCFRCHTQQRAESFEYSHHPMREGKVVCSDCHNPHGSAGPDQLKEFTVNETCYNCHADKRGPMLWEHQPVREDCLNCHTPHGSNEASLLKDRQNFMCASCHSSVSNESGGAFGGAHALPGNLEGTAMFNSALANNRMCLNCHSEIHGSNSPNGAYFFR